MLNLYADGCTGVLAEACEERVMLALMTLKSYAMVTFLAAVVLLAGYRWSRSANKRTSGPRWPA
jgi:hypothetical protein